MDKAKSLKQKTGKKRRKGQTTLFDFDKRPKKSAKSQEQPELNSSAGSASPAPPAPEEVNEMAGPVVPPIDSVPPEEVSAAAPVHADMEAPKDIGESTQKKFVRKRITCVIGKELYKRMIIWDEGQKLDLISFITGFFTATLYLSPEQLPAAVSIVANELAPPYENLELGIGDSIIMRAISESTGRKLARLKKEVDIAGDLGKVAKASRMTQRTMFQPKHLTMEGVLDTLRVIAKTAGSESVTRKKDTIKRLLVAARESEAQYIVRQLQGKLRIHVNMPTVLAALANTFMFKENEDTPVAALSSEGLKEPGEFVRQAYSERPSLVDIVAVLMENSISELPRLCTLQVGIPVQPMLAKPVKRVGEVIDKFLESKFTCEYKYDGERAQIHYSRDHFIKIFSRNLEDNTEKYPDILGWINEFIPESVTSFVADSEVVAYDWETQRIRPFQILSTRQRKAVKASDVKITVAVFLFDVLFFNGKSLISEPLSVRREILNKEFKYETGRFQRVTYEDFTGKGKEKAEVLEDEIMDLLKRSILGGCEGLMVKSMEEASSGGSSSSYEVAKRSQNWMKLKKDYLNALGDSVDLVPIGAYLGTGKRTGVYGAFLLACFNEESEEYESICKIGTGFSEKELSDITSRMKAHVIASPKAYYRLSKSVECDVYFEPIEVWEVKAADLSISPVHQAAVGHVAEDKGIALRFPRFERLREDKSPEMCTNSTQIVEMYKSQSL